MRAGKFDPMEIFPQGATRDFVASKFGIGSGKQYEKEKYIVDNQACLSPEEFADWDEGKLNSIIPHKLVKSVFPILETHIMVSLNWDFPIYGGNFTDEYCIISGACSGSQSASLKRGPETGRGRAKTFCPSQTGTDFAVKRREENHNAEVRNFAESIIENRETRRKKAEKTVQEKSEAKEKEQHFHDNLSGLIRINPKLAETYVQILKEYDVLHWLNLRVYRI